jgi:transposase
MTWKKPTKRVRHAEKTNRIMPLIETSVRSNPCRTCVQLSKDLGVSKELVRTSLHKLGFSSKRTRYYGVAKNALQLTRTFLKLRDAFIQQRRPIYSVDETGFGRFSYGYKTGWAPRGKEIRLKKAEPRKTTTSVLACCSSSGWVKTLEKTGAVNRAVFVQFLKELDLPEGSVIMMDNASIHQGDDVFLALRQKKYLPLYTPPYSPWFNPIEGCFSIVKRAYPASENVKASFDHLTPTHFASFFKRALCIYGVDDADAAANRAEMDKPDTAASTLKHKKKTARMATLSTTTKRKNSVRRHKLEGGAVVVEVRTVTVETVTRRARVDDRGHKDGGGRVEQ